MGIVGIDVRVFTVKTQKTMRRISKLEPD